MWRNADDRPVADERKVGKLGLPGRPRHRAGPKGSDMRKLLLGVAIAAALQATEAPARRPIRRVRSP